ncbi:MAG: Bug family tripartite tricarboxylate transporter substrate binding protein [Lautropia sp.]
MTTRRRTALLGTAMLLAAAIAPAAAWAQTGYPGRPVRIIVPFPPAGATDLIARGLGQQLSEKWGQPVVVENRPGAASIIGIDAVAKAAPDGYTLLLGSNTLSLNRLLYKSLPYNVDRDIAPVVLMTRIPNLLVVNPEVPARDLQQFIALAKSKPGQLNYASTGAGAAPHLFTELLTSMADIKLTHVPYQGTTQAELDLVNNRVQAMVMNLTGALPSVQSGRLRALGVTTTKRAPLAPEVPSISEAGLPGYEAVGWFGIATRKGTPPEIIDRLNTDINAVLRTESFRKLLAQYGGEVVGGTADEFLNYINAESDKWGKVVQSANIQLN